MCTKKYASYDDFACTNQYYPLFNEISNAETRKEMLKIVNNEYNLNNSIGFDTMFDHLKDNPDIQISACYKIAGNLLYEKMQYDKAIELYNLAYLHGSTNALVNIAKIHRKRGMIKQAYEILEPLINENHGSACDEYADMMFSEKKYEDAEKYAKIALEKENILAIQVLGKVYLTTRKFDKIQEFEKMVNLVAEIEEKYKHALYNKQKYQIGLILLAKLYIKTQNINLAHLTYDRVDNSDPTLKAICLAEKSILYALNNDDTNISSTLNKFEQIDGFNLLKKSEGFTSIRQAILLMRLSECYETNNMSKFLHYLLMCTNKEIPKLLKQLKNAIPETNDT